MNQLRTAREFCFQYFFHLQLPVFKDFKEQLQDTSKPEGLKASIENFKSSTNTLLTDQANHYVHSQILETLKNYDEIETVISSHLRNWKLNRLSKVDHTNLLLAVNEIFFTQNVPIKVSINEAIEISKKFGTSESSSFINGVLDSVAKSVKPR